jgi:hypothetical protein
MNSPLRGEVKVKFRVGFGPKEVLFRLATAMEKCRALPQVR